MARLTHRRTAAAILAAAAAAPVVAAPVAALSTTYTWTGAGGAGTGYDWTAGSNWAGGVAPPPAAADTAVTFDDSGQVAASAVNVPYAIETLTFNASATSYTVAGSRLTLGNPSAKIGFLYQNGTAAQTVNAPITLATPQGWHLSVGGGRVTLGGGVDTAGFNLAVYAADTSAAGDVLAGNLSGTGSLTVVAAGNLSPAGYSGTLTLTGANTYTGGTTIGNDSLLALGSAGALGTTGPIGFQFGTLQFSAANTTDYSARIVPSPNVFGQVAPYQIDTNGQNVTFAALSAGTAALPSSGLTKLGAGTLTLSGQSAVSGYLNVDAGTLALAGSANVSSGAYATVTGTATNPAVLSVGGTARLTGNTFMYVGYNGVGSVNQSAGTVDLSATGTMLYVGLAAGSQGSYLLTGGTADVYSLSVGDRGGAGTFTQQGGTVAVAGLSVGDGATVGGSGGYALSAGTLTATTGISIDNAGTPAVFQQSGGTVSATKVTVGFSYGGGVPPGSGTYTLTGGTLTTPALQLGLNGNSSGAFTLGGSGTLIAGTVTAGGTGAALHFDGGTFQPSASQTLSGLGTLDVRAGGAVFDVPAGVALSVAQPLTHDATAGAPAADGGLTKVDGGILNVLAANTYTGPTAVNGGYLVVANPTGSATGTGPVQVNYGGTLAGGGSVAGALTVNAGGTLAGTLTVGGAAAVAGTLTPNTAAVGRLTFNAGLALSATAAVAVDLNGSAAGTGYDQLAVAGGPVALAGTLTLTNDGTFHPAVGQGFTVVDHAGAAATTGGFANAPAGGFYAAPSGDLYQVSLAAADGDGTANDLVLTAVKVNLADGAIVIHNGSLATVTAEAAQGFAGGTWNGSAGYVSSTAAADPKHLTAVGVIQNATAAGGTTPIYTTFDGQAVSATDVLARYTYYGDTNLDGVVNAADYTRVDAGFVGHLTGWANGDFNYDGVVDGSDYTLMDNAFDQQAGTIAAPAGIVATPASDVAVAVPEPAAVGIAGLAVATVLGRRRRGR